MLESKQCFKIFEQSIDDYHVIDNIDAIIENPFKNEIEQLLYQKNWVDTVQWHLEDVVRDPDIEPSFGMEIKRRIDKSNQLRTDIVEKIDDWIIANLKINNESAPINTESPAWVIDRMSILALKIYHMNEQVERNDISDVNREKCVLKLKVLKEQKKDLSTSYNELMNDIFEGRKKMKVYRQMKMYNDQNLNPILYSKKNG